MLTGDATADDAIVPTGVEGVELIPAEPMLADVAVSLASEVGRERRCGPRLAALTGEHDVCLIDTGPTRSLVTSNVLNVADDVLVPIAPGLFGFLGLGQLRADMGLVRRFLENRSLSLLGIALVMLERNNVCRDFEAQMREAFGDLVFAATIPRAVKFEEANVATDDHLRARPEEPRAAAYQALTTEVMSRGHRTEEERDDAPLGHLRGDDAA